MQLKRTLRWRDHYGGVVLSASSLARAQRFSIACKRWRATCKWRQRRLQKATPGLQTPRSQSEFRRSYTIQLGLSSRIAFGTQMV